MPPKRNGRSAYMKAVNAEKRAIALAAASGASATVIGSDDERDESWAEEELCGVRQAPDLAVRAESSDDSMSEPELLDEERPGGRSARLSTVEPWSAASTSAAKLRKRKSRSGTASGAATTSITEFFTSSTPVTAPASSSAGASTDPLPPMLGTGATIGRPRNRADDDDELSLDFLSPRPANSRETYASHEGRRGSGYEVQGTKAERREARSRRSASTPSPSLPPPTPTPAPEPPRRSDFGTRHGPQLVAKMSKEQQESLLRIAAERQFRRSDFVDGEAMSAEEWAERRQAPWELRRAYAMANYVQLHFRDQKPSEEAKASAARTVQTGANAHPLMASGLHVWLHDYVTNGGRLQPSMRGRHRKTESYLSDQDIKAAAVLWLRNNILASKKKTDTTTPLTVERFQEYINDELLKEILADPASKRKKIGLETAREWLHLLGFSYCRHRKGMYVDGHERSDVTIDRMEKAVMLEVMSEVIVKIGGRDCELVIWPPSLHPDEPPVVAVSQDESAFHANDDIQTEWCENGKGMSLKQKSRGALLMVSEFLSEVHGRLRATPEQLQLYAAEHPASLVSQKLGRANAEHNAARPVESGAKGWAGDARIILEPGAGAGKDAWFDSAQLSTQSRLAMEIFEATHFAPARTVPLADGAAPVRVRFELGPASSPDGACRVQLSLGVRSSGDVKVLPRVRCQAMPFYDHSSGHGAAATDSLVISRFNKGPDWTGKVPQMRPGWFIDAQGVRRAQPMEFAEGDVCACSLACPPGIDPNGDAAAAPAEPPQVLPEQLHGRNVATESCSGLITGKVMDEVPDDAPDDLIVVWDEAAGLEDEQLTVQQVLEMLVGLPPDPLQHQEAPPTEAELASAFSLYFNGRRQTLKKKNDKASGDELRALAKAEWLVVAEERRLHFVRKVREKQAGPAAGAAAAAAQEERTFHVGDPVPRVLWGRNKGSEVVLAERGLLPAGGLKGACASESAHGHTLDGPAPRGRWQPPSWCVSHHHQRAVYLNNCCCCKRLLGAQPDFQNEPTSLERIVGARHWPLFLPKFHCELNWIERYWGAAKRYCRKHCGYSLVALRAMVPICLSQSLDELPADLRGSPELPACPVYAQRRHARVSWQYFAEYLKGVNCCEAVMNVGQKRTSRHRDMSDRRSLQSEAAMEAAATAALRR